MWRATLDQGGHEIGPILLLRSTAKVMSLSTSSSQVSESCICAVSLAASACSMDDARTITLRASTTQLHQAVKLFVRLVCLNTFGLELRHRICHKKLNHLVHWIRTLLRCQHRAQTTEQECVHREEIRTPETCSTCVVLVSTLWADTEPCGQQEPKSCGMCWL